MSQVPDPPEDFDPLIETITPGTVIYRLHNTVFEGQVENDGTMPNPGYGRPTRFGFFGDPVVPTLYAASSAEAVAHETILHSHGPGTSIPLTRLTLRAITPLEVIRPLTLVSYRSAGLRRFGLYPRDLTDTLADEYPQTVTWAEAAWEYGADGVVYMCRHFNGETAYCLFGADHSNNLKAQPGWPPRRHPTLLQWDRDWLVEVAAQVGVHIDITS